MSLVRAGGVQLLSHANKMSQQIQNHVFKLHQSDEFKNNTDAAYSTFQIMWNVSYDPH